MMLIQPYFLSKVRGPRVGASSKETSPYARQSTFTERPIFAKLAPFTTMNPSARWIIPRADHQASLLDVMARRLNLSKKQAKRLLDAHAVFVNQRRVWMARHTVHDGDCIEVLGAAKPSTRPDSKAPISILQESDDWLVANKPAALLSNGPGSLEMRLREQRQEPELEAVHRIDRDTTGCVLYARHRSTRPDLVALFETKTIHKTYVALVQGSFPRHMHRVEKGIEGLEAITEFRVLDANARASLIEARPLTGRTHQIRLHVRALGHPLAGDRVYATGVVEDETLRRLPRQMLHAWRLDWTDPSGKIIKVIAPWPVDFRQAMTSLGLRANSPPT
jgi:RluA family pseudouridine synthase